VSSVKEALRAATTRRDAVAARRQKLRGAASTLSAERRSVSDTADANAERYRKMQADFVSGEGSEGDDVPSAKAEARASAERLSDIDGAAMALSDKIETVAVELAVAEQLAAHARENALVALAAEGQPRLRALAAEFAESLASFYQQAEQASHERFLSTGQRGIEPVAVSGPAMAWLVEVLASRGLSRDLRVIKRRPPLSERELMDISNTEANAPTEARAS
jgi:hypothetical protein